MAYKCTVIVGHYRNNKKRKRGDPNEQLLLLLPHQDTTQIPHSDTVATIKTEITEEEQSVQYPFQQETQTEQPPHLPQLSFQTEIDNNKNKSSNSMQLHQDEDVSFSLQETISGPKMMVSRSTSMSPRRLKKFKQDGYLASVAQARLSCHRDVLFYQHKLEELNEKNRRNERKILNLEAALVNLRKQKKHQPRFRVTKMVQIKREK